MGLGEELHEAGVVERFVDEGAAASLFKVELCGSVSPSSRRRTCRSLRPLMSVCLSPRSSRNFFGF